MKDCEIDIVSSNIKESINNLKIHGITCYRNIEKSEIFSSLQKKTHALLSNPAILGSVGYYQKDSHKRLYPGLLVGEEIFKIWLTETIIEIVEKYLEKKVMLQEIMLKHDLGDSQLYFPKHAHTGSYRTSKNEGPFSVGILLYMHDTSEGAFCYSFGTHNWNVPHGEKIENYPDELKLKIDKNMKRISGKAGDIILFDHRGFHGPDQPAKKPRTVYLGGMWIAEDHDFKVKCPTPIYTHMLGSLSSKQLEVIGQNARGSLVDIKDFHYFSFDKQNKFFFRFIRKNLELYFKFKNFFDKFKNR